MWLHDTVGLLADSSGHGIFFYSIGGIFEGRTVYRAYISLSNTKVWGKYGALQSEKKVISIV